MHSLFRRSLSSAVLHHQYHHHPGCTPHARLCSSSSSSSRACTCAGRSPAAAAAAAAATDGMAGPGAAPDGGHSQVVTSEFLSVDEDLPPGTHLHLIILNYVLPRQTAALWSRATTRICADGGANRLYDQIVAMAPALDAATARATYLPDLIKGDLDSVRQDVQEFYTARGVPMVDLSSDQETTDLEKCLLYLEGRLRALSQQQQQQHHGQHGQREGQQHAAMAAPAARHQPGGATAGAAAGGVSGLGHGAKAIGAANAARAASGKGAHSSSHASSCAECGGRQQQQPEWRHSHNGQRQQEQQQQQGHSSQAAPQHSITGELLVEAAEAAETAGQPPPAAAVAAGAVSPPAGSSHAGSCLTHAAAGPSSSSNGGHGSGGALAAALPGAQQACGVLDDSDRLAQAGQADDAPPSKRLRQEHVILVLGALGGRLDHTLSNLNTLYCYRHLNMALWGDGNLVRLLRAGHSVIRPSRLEGPTCGLVPLARPATASSSGLKWDLRDTHMCFRGLLSTSNVIAADTIEVATDEDLLWITSVAE